MHPDDDEDFDVQCDCGAHGAGLFWAVISAVLVFFLIVCTVLNVAAVRIHL